MQPFSLKLHLATKRKPMKYFLLLISIILLSPSSIHAQKKINIKEGVKINGITQWIGMSGKDDRKPLLLFLHGGPGFSSRNYSKSFVNTLERHFIVVQWDQRETGITDHWNQKKDSLSTDKFHQDTYEVVQYLLKTFSRDKLYLVGYSWGGYLGLHFASQHPEMLYAYISVSGIINPQESERLALDWINKKAEETNDSVAQAEIAQITIPFENWEDIYYQRKWTAYYSGKNISARTFPPALFQSWSSKWLDVFNEASRVNYFEQAPALQCPVYFFVSNKDYVCNYTVTQRYYNAVKADKKGLTWFSESTHEIPTDEPSKFSEEVIRIGSLQTP
jgi:proline iminopeptidase